MNKLTYNFLKRSQKYSLKRVSVGVSTPLIPDSLHWSSDPTYSVFGISTPKGDSDYDGWPAIWAVVRDFNLGGGCGNHNQRQLKLDHGLEVGVYVFRNNKWKKVQE